ncbi:hypothetical protein FFWV33_12295 [Flavobacterium faecale]|uniref:Uncharacterized protein n=1 Tax=Flavobacterium faecale TaxID=1355330 RepID=A0A2S1LF02_9FLAO|nr:hypothetical protein [Flavobacterium faecale]AWG22241.1 hypothetical protein FFWV33_12295 [Flavobacterium faecale]
MDKIINIISEDSFTGADGKEYIRVISEIKTQRKTYVRGILTGKYRGNQINEGEFYNEFDFEIYEASVNCTFPQDFQKNKIFSVPSNNIFPVEKLPTTLLVQLITQNTSFGINIIEPIVYDFKTIRKLHQTEGEEVFGSFTSGITGYILDYEREEVIHINGPIVESNYTTTIQNDNIQTFESSGIKTGKFIRKDNYIKFEFYSKQPPSTIWGEWIYQSKPKISSNTSGCWSVIPGFIAVILGFLFIIAILPSMLYIFPIGIAIFLINILAPYLKWFFRVIGILLLLLFIGSLGRSLVHSSRNFNPKPIIVDSQNEQNSDTLAFNETEVIENNRNLSEKLIKRYRIWKDYENNQYEGYYTLVEKDIYESKKFKNDLHLRLNSVSTYDQIIYNIKENDKYKLQGLYHLFDSINSKNQLSRIKFAEMIVSFVQDIPYAIILDNDCNPNLYDDRFTHNYLLQPDAICDGYQKFGINTPVEFLANLKGDCDSRTILLYTIFSHYDYDVAILSSEFYSHSILGINLPINGLSYVYRSQNYILWETTAPNCKPGIISNQMSNLNNWRISLKSK